MPLFAGLQLTETSVDQGEAERLFRNSFVPIYFAITDMDDSVGMPGDVLLMRNQDNRIALLI
jgi:hypothetical protein